MARDKRTGSGPPGKPKIAAVPRPSARPPVHPPPAACRAKKNKRRLLPVAPSCLFPPPPSTLLRTRWPRPPVSPAPAHVLHHVPLVPPLFENARVAG